MNATHRPIIILSACALVAGLLGGLLMVHRDTSSPTPAALTATTIACTAAVYSRARFGNEPTAQTRAAVAARQANADGTITDPYTGLTQTGTVGLDADHVVPLDVAWTRGANCWPPAERVAFAHDVHFLELVSAHLNRSKGSQPLDVWQPPVNACGYARLYVQALAFWRLPVTPAEDATVSRVCAGIATA